jgi:hypothetical protein
MSASVSASLPGLGVHLEPETEAVEVMFTTSRNRSGRSVKMAWTPSSIIRLIRRLEFTV